MVNRAHGDPGGTSGAQGITVALGGAVRRSSREHRANQPGDLCCDKASLRRMACVFLCRACQSVLGDSGSLVAAYSLHGPSNIYSSTSVVNKRTMVALRATTRNVVHGEDGELSCACGAALGRAVDRDTYEEGDVRVLNGSFQLDTSSLIRYRLGVDADVRLEGENSDQEEEDMCTEREIEGQGGDADVRRHRNQDRERRHGRGGATWDDAVRGVLMDLKRRVRALESNFNHHDRELTDHFNSIRSLEAAVGRRGGP